jgi:hypothetical protein
MSDDIASLKKQVQDLQQKIQEKEEEVTPPKEANVPETAIYEWEAPVRDFHKWEKERISTVILIAAVVVLICIFLHEFIALVAVIAITALFIALVTIPPTYVIHRITNKGIHSFDHLYLWNDMRNFWIADKKGIYVMHINTKMGYPTRLFFVLPDKDIQKVVSNVSPYIKYFERRDTQGPLSRSTDGIYIKFGDITKLTPSTPAV